MASKNSFKILLAFFFAALMCSAAWADVYHYRNILVGGRASGLGGAYTALSDDPDGLYYNPAGVVYSYGNNLSASANAYHSSVKEYKGALGRFTWGRRASAILPNFFGVVQEVGKARLGLSYVVPDSIIEDQDQTFRNLGPSVIDTTDDGVDNPATTTNITQFVINFNNGDKTLNIGPSAAFEITENFSAGLSLYVHYRRSEWILNQYITHDTGHFQWNNTYFESEEWGINPVLGFMAAPMEKVALGLSVSRVFIYDSDTTRQQITNFTFNDATLRQVASSDGKREYPYAITLGGAYFPSDSLLLSMDVSYHSSTEDEFIGKREAVWNAALGSEYYLSRSLALRGGLFTNFSSAPDVKPGLTDQPEQVDLFGGSLSLSYFGRGASLSLGGTYSYGSGDAQVVSGSTEIQELTAQTWTIFLSTSYTF